MWQVLYLIIVGPCVSTLLNNHVHNINSEIISITGDSNRENVYKTTHGEVRGYVDDGILQFFDIPYGKISEDHLFQEPSQPDSWENLLENQKHESRCPQMIGGSIVGDLKCLTLSVFKKHTTTADNALKDDVLFHIHDSFFSNGSGDPLIYGPKHLVQDNIILVLPNYRLGALGFLCLQNETAPGNAALKDLTLALKWTEENIGNFGGNASNIVISGAGAGGALVEYLLISNASRTNISRAITESGFSLSPWAIDRNPTATASSLTQLIQSKMDLEKLVKDSTTINFRPCIEKEGGFMSESPWKLLGKHRTRMAYMTGSANHAAWGKAINYNLTQLNRDLSLLLPNNLVFRNDVEKLRIAMEVKAFYFGGRDVITRTDVNQLSQLFTDSEYLGPGLRAARVLAKGGANVFFYEYSFNNPDLQQTFNTSTRGDSLAYVFSRSDQAQETEEQAAMRKVMTQLWVSFIKSGIPSSEDSVSWSNLRDVAPADEEWLSIGSEVQTQKGVHLSRSRLWQEIYDNYFIDNSGFIPKPVIHVYILVIGLTFSLELQFLRREM